MSVVVGGEPGVWVDFSGEILEVLSARPFAPGAPVSIEVDGTSLQGKSLGSKRQPDGRFHVRMRMINLRRAHRVFLLAKSDAAKTGARS